MELTSNIIAYIEAHREEALELLMELARIPAPSHHEELRAEFCKQWLTAQGAEGVYIDDALNVIYPIGCSEDNPLVVFMAHSDVVFPDTEPLPLVVEDGKIKCPGVGDDTANVVAMLMAAKYIAENKLQPKDGGMLIVVNSCEEGLGNLKGSRKIVADFGHRITEFFSLDGTAKGCVAKAVGSKRYRVEAITEGGHSYSNFGNRNAIAVLADLIHDLYQVQVPALGKTTYNVGEIKGGTSVNTIAQQAEMLYEFRSDEGEALEIMQRHLDNALETHRAKGAQLHVTLVGDRPCGENVDEAKHQALLQRTASAVTKYFGIDCPYRSGSTDCNIPLSVGIPAVCVGCYFGGGAHTRQEYVEIDSLLPGLKLAFDLILYHF